MLLYNGRTQQLERQVTRFKDIAYSGSYRVDGRLLTAGGETGIVQVHRLCIHPICVTHMWLTALTAACLALCM